MTRMQLSAIRLPAVVRGSMTVLLVMAGMVLAACGQTTAPDEHSATVAAQAPSQLLDVLVEDYYEQYLKLNPLAATANGDMRFNDRLPNTLS